MKEILHEYPEKDSKERDKSGRNQGIECLRVLAMFGIVLQHLMGHGGITKSLTIGTAGLWRYTLIWFVLLIIYSSVDCYALISGYVGYSDNSQIELRIWKFITLWLETLFYSVTIAVILRFLPCCKVSGLDLVKSMLPLSFNQYWYFSAYAGLYFLRPFLNKLIQCLSEKECRVLAAVCLIVFSLYAGTLGKISDPFRISNGSSMAWLATLYVIGGLAKKGGHPENFGKKSYIYIYISAICDFFHCGRSAVPFQIA